jgi:hypothetical protein
MRRPAFVRRRSAWRPCRNSRTTCAPRECSYRARHCNPARKASGSHFITAKRTIIDGPFTESKELVAGFSIEQVDSIDDAILWAERFARLIGDVEIDVRVMREPSELS